MIVIKRIFKSLVAVTACFCILAVTSFSAFASGVDDNSDIKFIDFYGDVSFTVPVDEFDMTDYALTYDDYLYFKDNVVTYNAAAGVLGYSGGLAWSAKFAELGLTCPSGGMFFLGIGLLGTGAICYAVDGLYDVVTEDVPEVFYDTISLIYMNSSDATREWLEEAFDLYYAGEEITVPVSVSQDIANVINALELRDSEGNIINTALSISAAYISSVFADAYPETVTISGADNIMFPFIDARSQENPIVTVSNNEISLTVEGIYTGGSYPSTNLFTFENLVTGTSVTLDFGSIKTGAYASTSQGVSDFYLTIFENGCQFFYPYISWYPSDGKLTSARPYTPSHITSDYPLTINDSGTVLDGKTITSVTWNETADNWTYEFDDGLTTAFPLDPFSLLLSSTGVGVIGNTGSIGITATPNKDDEKFVIPPIPLIPVDVGGNVTGIPISDTLLEDAPSNVKTETDTKVDADTLESDISLDNKDGLLDFLGNIVSFFGGMFDWLPDDMRDLLDQTMAILQGAIIAMAAVKIVDILWP